MTSAITFVVAVASAIALGTVGAWWLMIKLMRTKKGKDAIKDATKDLTDLTYDILKENMKDTKRWEELMTMSAE